MKDKGQAQAPPDRSVATEDDISAYYAARAQTPKGVNTEQYAREDAEIARKKLFNRQGQLLTITPGERQKQLELLHPLERQKQLERMKNVNQKAGLNPLGAAQHVGMSKQQAMQQQTATALGNSIAERDNMLQTRVDDLKKQVEAAGNRDPLLQATNEVLLDENKRLMEEVRGMKEERETMQVRLDAANDRLYKTIDILQERAVAGKKDESS